MLTYMIIVQAATIAILIYTHITYRRTLDGLLEHATGLQMRLNASLSVAAPFMAMIANAETRDHSTAAFDQKTTNRLHREYFFARTGEVMPAEVG